MPASTSDSAVEDQNVAAIRHTTGCDVSDTADARLADACHDLRQPLQTLVLLQALLAKVVEGEQAKKLVERVGTSIDAMVATLEGLLDSKPFPTRSPGNRASQSADTLPKEAALRDTANLSVDAAFAPVVFVVDDDSGVRAAIRSVLEDDGQIVEEFASCEAFLERDRGDRDGCLLIDAYLPAMGGLELLQHLQAARHMLPAIMITGNSDVAMAVNAMKAGAVDFIEKPIGREELLASIARALEQSKDLNKQLAWQQDASRHIAGLTARQHEIMAMVLAGHPSKNIAADLGISQRTVENHRASIMKRTGAKSLPALARLAVAAATATSRQLPTASSRPLPPVLALPAA